MKSVNLIQVRVIFKKKAATLVEFFEQGYPKRVSVRSSSVVSQEGKNYVSRQDLESGLSYGIPWKYKLKSSEVTPETLEVELHRAGIWTAEDAIKNPNAIQSALMAAYRTSLVDILDIAKQFLYKEN